MDHPINPSLVSVSDESPARPIEKARCTTYCSPRINIPDEPGEKIRFSSFSNNSSARVRIHIKEQRWNVILLVSSPVHFEIERLASRRLLDARKH